MTDSPPPSPDARVAALTDAEKVALLTGQGMWRTHGVERLGIPALLMTDGAYGVRYSIHQIDGQQQGGQDLEAFLGVVGTRARDMKAAFGSTRPATCYPNGSAIACSWDLGTAYALGASLAAECRAFGVNILLGPGINIRRTPLGGRGYEYYSEDPVLTGDFATQVVLGLQDNGVGASLKHFACNNSEIERTTMDSRVEPRALREIYLLGYERVVTKARPWTVMSSYNRLNGAQTSQDPWLLTDVLRGEWGFDGVVVSDWHGIKERPASLAAGNDLDMPQNASRQRDLARAIAEGSLPAEVVDRACARMLALIDTASAAAPTSPEPFDEAAHHQRARDMAAQSLVLLRNEGAALPLDPARHGMPQGRLLVVGDGAIHPVIQGSGSATTLPTRLDIPLGEIRALAGEGWHIAHVAGHLAGAAHGEALDPAEVERLRDEAVAAARGADAVIVFATADAAEDGEGADRRSLSLAPGHDALIAALAGVSDRVIVVLANPDAVTMPWVGDVAAIVETFLAGQGMGWALAQVLFGAVNPSGKLTVSFAERIEDTPAYLSYPGEAGVHPYAEGLFVGYRFYDKRRIAPLFPFGFGLSYTSFAYGDLAIATPLLREGEDLEVSLSVTNSGPRAGGEVVQLYLGHPESRVQRPLRELRGFAKLALEPGETRRVTLTVPARDLCFFDAEIGAWRLEDGALRIEIGASSRDIRLTGEARCAPAKPHYPPLAIDSQPRKVLANPVARAHFERFLGEKLGLDAEQAARMLAYTSSSFFGIRTTLNYFFRQDLDREEIAGIIAAINAECQA